MLINGNIRVGLGVGFGVGLGVGFGVGFGVGLGVGLGVGFGVGFAIISIEKHHKQTNMIENSTLKLTTNGQTQGLLNK